AGTVSDPGGKIPCSRGAGYGSGPADEHRLRRGRRLGGGGNLPPDHGTAAHHSGHLWSVESVGRIGGSGHRYVPAQFRGDFTQNRPFFPPDGWPGAAAVFRSSVSVPDGDRKSVV